MGKTCPPSILGYRGWYRAVWGWIAAREVCDTGRHRLRDNGMQLFTDAQNAAALAHAAGGSRILVRYLQAPLNHLHLGDYVCILAYIERNATHYVLLQTMRQAVRDAQQVATYLGYGRRFLHPRVETFMSWLNVG